MRLGLGLLFTFAISACGGGGGAQDSGPADAEWGTCGDGRLDPGEDCDPPDDVTCDDACNFLPPTTEVSCTNGEDDDNDGNTDCEDGDCDADPACEEPPPEDCDNGADDDEDGDADCDDGDCVNAQSCLPVGLGTCAEPTYLADPTTVTGDTTGRSSNAQANCQFSGTTGPDIVYRVTAAQGGFLWVRLEPSASLGVYVRSSCEDQATELGCVTNYGSANEQNLAIPVVAGQVVYIIVDAWLGTDAGAFTLHVESRATFPEFYCENYYNDDMESNMDCGDPDCQGRPVCMAGTSPTGGVCDANNDCAANMNDPLCLPEWLYGWPSGYCSQFCVTDVECGTSGICASSDIGNLCVETCSTAADCTSPGYICQNIGAVNACLPACTAHDQCPDTGYCDPVEQLCRTHEWCDDGVDNTGEGWIDCEDYRCSTTAECADACMTPIVLAEATSTSGDTTGAGTDFYGDCTGGGGTDVLYTYTPGTAGQRGEVNLTVTASTYTGISVRETCADWATVVTCTAGTPPPTLNFNAEGGIPLYFIVDQLAGSAGPYTITASFTPDVCGDSMVTGFETCDDGNTVDGDGCGSDCLVELDAYCMAATPAVEGPQMGDTTGGTNIFSASCTGGNNATEDIYTITAPGDASTVSTLNLTLASATDQGIYVLSDCLDPSTVMACTDAFVGGTDETLSVPGIAGGTVLTIVVDGFFSPTTAGPYTLTVDWVP